MQEYYELKTPAGTLRGFFHKPNLEKYPVCLIFHGFTGQATGTKFCYVTIARELEKQGIGTVRLDFLGSGQSDLDFKDMTFGNELSSAINIIEEVLKQPQTTDIYVLGHSMGGAIASELAKLYPTQIKKLCLWAPAFNLPEAMTYLRDKVLPIREGIYDHKGFAISQTFVDDISERNLYQGLDIYQNQTCIIHGTKDTTVPFEIHEKYCQGFTTNLDFQAIEGADHNFDSLLHIEEAVEYTLGFLTDKTKKK